MELDSSDFSSFSISSRQPDVAVVREADEVEDSEDDGISNCRKRWLGSAHHTRKRRESGAEAMAAVAAAAPRPEGGRGRR
jgi:hypothetical protein